MRYNANKKLMVTAALQAAALLAAGAVFGQTAGQSGSGAPQNGSGAPQNLLKPAIADKDLVIRIGEVTENAVFYPVDIDGTRLEVMAVKAPDGSIRTAFNTCQVCYGSGRGFYKQQGTVLVCQNCGNRFRMSQVETRGGGCNPVPVFPQNKTVTAETITISKEFLKEAKFIFARWKRG